MHLIFFILNYFKVLKFRTEPNFSSIISFSLIMAFLNPQVLKSLVDSAASNPWSSLWSRYLSAIVTNAVPWLQTWACFLFYTFYKPTDARRIWAWPPKHLNVSQLGRKNVTLECSCFIWNRMFLIGLFLSLAFIYLCIKIVIKKSIILIELFLII